MEERKRIRYKLAGNFYQWKESPEFVNNINAILFAFKGCKDVLSCRAEFVNEARKDPISGKNIGNAFCRLISEIGKEVDINIDESYLKENIVRLFPATNKQDKLTDLLIEISSYIIEYRKKAKEGNFILKCQIAPENKS
ncbi:MAG: hypothetical protein LBL16_03760 [Endomicrobium sp.]|jgi:hypothetical protein|nr:hypothetical protein [Endomicrobium sp.]